MTKAIGFVINNKDDMAHLMPSVYTHRQIPLTEEERNSLPAMNLLPTLSSELTECKKLSSDHLSLIVMQ